jgi:glycosyltransferase involved in cell wall biosynthesis
MHRDVLHILGTAQPEGSSVGHTVADLAKGLDPGRYRLHAWFLTGGGPLADELRANGVQVRILNWQRGARDPLGAWQLWQNLRASRFAIVHQHYGGRSVCWIARRASRAPIVYQIWGRVLEHNAADPAPFRVPGADVVIAISNAVAGLVRGAKPRVIYAGVQIPESVTRPEEGRVIGVAGRLVPIKDISTLLHALACLCSRFPDLQLEIAGSGPEQLAIEREIQLLGLEKHVRLLGWQSDLSSSFSRWDIYAQPSLEDAFPISVLEAMAAGLPVVASAVGGLPELVENGVTGWLVPPRDPAALAERIEALLLDPSKSKGMGDAGRVRARENFSAARMVASVQNLYDELLAE